LWAAQRASEASENHFMFPKYCSEIKVSSNSASAASNKWLQHKINDRLVIHSLRHVMRDRLRNIECPVDIIDEIGGWTRGTIGDNYGLGHSLAVKYKWLSILLD
jgi:integrase